MKHSDCDVSVKDFKEWDKGDYLITFKVYVFGGYRVCEFDAVIYAATLDKRQAAICATTLMYMLDAIYFAHKYLLEKSK